MNNILVSITCVAFNHENYIAEAIDGFLMQKTNFKYEILLHDDASTDKTATIIKKYEQKYPNIINPIYQTENQFSQGIKVVDFNRKRAQGKYIAVCEGDDYWTDPAKLQKQVDYMERHPECSVCVHAALKVDAKTKRVMGSVRPSKKGRDFSLEEVILGGGGLFATNTMLYRNEFAENMPQFYYEAPIGDFPLMIHLAICGKVHYIDEVMAVYRIGASNSWTAIMSTPISNKKVQHIDKVEKMLNEVDEYTHYAYSDIINEKIIRNRFYKLLLEKKMKDAKRGVYREYYKSLPGKEKFKIHIKQFFPIVYRVYRRLNGNTNHGH